MKCQSLFSGKNEKTITSLLSAELAQRVSGKQRLLYDNFHIIPNINPRYPYSQRADIG